MESTAPEPESDDLMDRVKRLEDRMMRFEQDFRTMNVPSAEAPDTDVTASPASGEDTIQEADHEKAPEGL